MTRNRALVAGLSVFHVLKQSCESEQTPTDGVLGIVQ